MANVDAALEQQVLDVPQAERGPRIHHHGQANDLRRGVKKWNRLEGFLGQSKAQTYPVMRIRPTGAFALAMPDKSRHGS